MYLLSQVLIIVAFLFYYLSQAFENKKPILYYPLWVGYSVLFSVHYFCLEAYTGAWIYILGAVVMVLTSVFAKLKKAVLVRITLIAAMAISVLIAVLTWDTAISLLPMFVMIISYATSLIYNDYIKIIGSIISAVLNIIYLVVFASWAGVVFEVISIILTIFMLVMLIWSKHMNSQTELQEK